MSVTAMKEDGCMADDTIQKDGSSSGASSQDDKNTIRGNWGNKVEFILSVVGFCVGFGNVWRFPYLCYRNGGGAFLIPYFLMLFLVGVPLYFLELAIGQYASLGVVAVWKLSPMFKGIGLTTVITVAIVSLYYNTLLAYVIFYLFASMTSELPWVSCGNAWNTPSCAVREPSPSCHLNSTCNETILGTIGIQLNVSDSVVYNNTMTGLENLTASSAGFLNLSAKPTSPAEEYFERYVLDLSSGIDDMGPVRWQMVLCFLLAWMLVYACVAKGIEFSGKVVYFTATFPYMVLLILLVRGLTLPGAFEGLKFYVIPRWEYLMKPRVWGEAASQIFYSLGPAWGCLIVYGSYNKFHNKCNIDAVVSSFICSGTSLLAGAVIFSIIGFMAHELNVPISEVMTSGPGLAFIAYPEAIARMPLAPFWAIIFFFMLLTVGLDSSMAQIELIMIPVIDAVPKLQKKKWLVSLIICVVYFVTGIPFCTRGGMYLVNLLDWYSATFTFIVIAIAENLILVYVYGYKNLESNICLMLGAKPSIFYKVCLYFVTPVMTSFILIFNIINHSPVTYNDIAYPPWAVSFGLFIGTAPLIFIPGYMLYYYCSYLGSFQRFREVIRRPWTGKLVKELLRPAPGWGPMMPQHRLAAGLEVLDEELSCMKGEKQLNPLKTHIEETHESKTPFNVV